MARSFHLPPDFNWNTEIRVQYDMDADNMNMMDIMYYGIKCDIRFLMRRLEEYEEVDMSQLSIQERIDLQRRGAIVKKPSVIQELVNRGYDMESFVLSMKKIEPEMKKAPDNSDIICKLDHVKEKLMNLQNKMYDRLSEIKGVYVCDENDFDDIQSDINQILEQIPD